MMTTPNPQDQTTPPAFVALVDSLRQAVVGSILINLDSDAGWTISVHQTTDDDLAQLAHVGYGIGGTLDDAAQMCAEHLGIVL